MSNATRRLPLAWVLVALLGSSPALAQEVATGSAAATEPASEASAETVATPTEAESVTPAQVTAATVATPTAAASAAPEPAQVVTAEDDVEAPAPPREDEFGLRGHVELGFLAVMAHELTLGTGGTRLDYVNDFQQSNLYFNLRLAIDFDIWRQHILTFVYQPIDIVTTSSLPRDVVIDGLDYPMGTPVRARYGFPFYRFGWAFDVLDAREHELAFGLGLQIRNATIEFESTDGALLRTRQDVGPVPLLRARGRFALTEAWFLAFDIDGFYAFIPGLNGTDNNVEGAILDASVRVGWRFMPHVDAFVNARYIGGGAAGQGDPTPTSDGFQRNWLHFLAITAGATFDTRP